MLGTVLVVGGRAGLLTRCLMMRHSPASAAAAAATSRLFFFRPMCSSSPSSSSSPQQTKPASSKKEVSVTFVKYGGQKQTVKAKVGQNLLDVIVDNSVDIDGFGACEGTLACSTCHVVLKKEDFDRLPDEATDEELDMLDLAYGLTETSRLGCQICMTPELDGLEVRVPEGVNDQR